LIGFSLGMTSLTICLIGFSLGMTSSTTCLMVQQFCKSLQLPMERCSTPANSSKLRYLPEKYMKIKIDNDVLCVAPVFPYCSWVLRIQNWIRGSDLAYCPDVDPAQNKLCNFFPFLLNDGDGMRYLLMKNCFIKIYFYD
jgi:hypothetical protein